MCHPSSENSHRQIRSSEESYNNERAVELWNASVILTAANQSAKLREKQLRK
jgi:hypothetical protein